MQHPYLPTEADWEAGWAKLVKLISHARPLSAATTADTVSDDACSHNLARIIRVLIALMCLSAVLTLPADMPRTKNDYNYSVELGVYNFWRQKRHFMLDQDVYDVGFIKAGLVRQGWASEAGLVRQGYRGRATCRAKATQPDNACVAYRWPDTAHSLFQPPFAREAGSTC